MSRPWTKWSVEVQRVEDIPASVLGDLGLSEVFPAAAVRRAFAEAGLALEPMDTGAACRTYNVLLAEGRPVGAALIAVG